MTELTEDTLCLALGALMNEKDRQELLVGRSAKHITANTTDNEITDNLPPNQRMIQEVVKYRDILRAIKDIDNALS